MMGQMNIEQFTSISKVEIEAIKKALPHMALHEKIELLDDLDVRERRASLTAAKTNMLGFATSVYPGFKIGPHHRKLAKIFTDVVEGKKKRVIINIAPRMGKSEFSSYLFPAYFLGKYPNKKIIMGTHTAGLSEDFGRRVRKLPVSGLQALAVSIMLLVSGALLLVVVLICSLLTILTRSRTLKSIVDWLLIPHGRGSRPGRSNV
jgi:hypothetical protein